MNGHLLLLRPQFDGPTDAMMIDFSQVNHFLERMCRHPACDADIKSLQSDIRSAEHLGTKPPTSAEVEAQFFTIDKGSSTRKPQHCGEGRGQRALVATDSRSRRQHNRPRGQNSRGAPRPSGAPFDGV